MDTKMNNYHNYVDQLIQNDDNDNIIIILKRLYKLLKSYNNKQRNYWIKYYLFSNFINYILSSNILNKMEWEYRRFYNIQIMIRSPSPPVYRP